MHHIIICRLSFFSVRGQRTGCSGVLQLNVLEERQVHWRGANNRAVRAAGVAGPLALTSPLGLRLCWAGSHQTRRPSADPVVMRTLAFKSEVKELQWKLHRLWNSQESSRNSQPLRTLSEAQAKGGKRCNESWKVPSASVSALSGFHSHHAGSSLAVDFLPQPVCTRAGKNDYFSSEFAELHSFIDD